MSLNAVPTENKNLAFDQACALLFRVSDGQIEFCLITSSAGRWMFPKGYVEPGETFAEAALKEAHEEAGLHGQVIGDPIGCYEIEKKGQQRSVIVLMMEVSRCDDHWEEADFRERRWVRLGKARRLVSDPELVETLDVAEKRLRAA